MIPQHVAIILDGNGRWAKSKGMPRNYGHAQGSKNVEAHLRGCLEYGHQISDGLCCFPRKTGSGPRKRWTRLMRLFRSYTKTCLKTAAEK